ncbi:hypothetical protein [Cryobacterium sp. Y57]|uniref:hypothetical protein n=1 Tax=Cryobacterium sp. Y57 TaxID=2048287 RepID=UPI000CE36450|nr:hypothetical protein [Cryobacterium sp. Y57]
MSDKKISPRKIRNTAANEERHAANVARVSTLDIGSYTSEHVKLRRDAKGNTYAVTVTRRVSPSKMLRTADRHRARLIAGQVAAAAARAEDAAIEAELAETVR